MNRRLLLVGLPAAALLCARPGELVAQQFFDSFRYKASHNSYERGVHPAGPPVLPYSGVRIALWEQVLAFNCYMLELDMCKKDDGTIIVKHECGLLFVEFDAYDLRSELLSRSEIYERFTIVHIEAKSITCCNGWGSWDSGDDEELEEFWTDAIPASQVYTYDEWVADGRVWPTVPQLIARGKHFAFEHGRGPTDPYGFFFRGSLDSPGPNASFIGEEDGLADGGDTIVPGDALIFRGYPNRYWDDGLISGPILWDQYINNGMNELATNEIGWFYTKGGGTYPSYPMYIKGSHGGDEWGTPILPFNTINEGITRINSTVPVPNDVMLMKIEPGTYSISGGSVTTHVRFERLGSSGEVRITN